MRGVAIPALAGALTLTACGPGTAPTFTARDSAGVSIVESSAPTDGTRPRYQVDSVPAVEIRSAGGVGSEFGPGVIPAEFTDGRIVVADPSTTRIHLFNPRGEKLKSFGRKGHGPGEFEAITSIAPFATDSLVAYDMFLRRYSVFSDTGAFARSGTFTAGTALPIPVGAFRDGALLIRDGFPLRPSGIAGPAVFTGGRTGEQQAATPLLRVPLDGTAVDSIGSIPGSEVLVQTGDQSMSIMPIHFGRIAVVTARDSVAVSGNGEGFEFEIRHQNGRLLGRFRRPSTAHAVTSTDLDALIKAQLADLPAGSREDMQRRLRATPNRELMPQYDRVLVSDVGEIWVRHSVAPAGDNRLATWSVFSAWGEWLCDVQAPTPFLPYTITGNHLLGTWTDDNGDLFIQVRGLRTP